MTKLKQDKIPPVDNKSDKNSDLSDKTADKNETRKNRIKKDGTKKNPFNFAVVVLPIFLTLLSLGLGIQNWIAQRNGQWEAGRALVNIDIEARLLDFEGDKKIAYLEVIISNVGDVSFLIRDIQFSFSLQGDIHADWEDISLLQDKGVTLPLGINGFSYYQQGIMAANYAFDSTQIKGAWHIIDPRRSVSIPITLTVEGVGVLNISSTLFAHAVSLMDFNNEIRDYHMINGTLYSVSPEYGFDTNAENAALALHNNQIVYPFSANQILVVGDSGLLSPPNLTEFNDHD